MLRQLLTRVAGHEYAANAPLAFRVGLESKQPCDNPEPPAKGPCFFLEKLPPELRLRVYEYLLLYPRRLVPYVAQKSQTTILPTSRWQRETSSSVEYAQVDITAFCLNRQIYEESANLFYGHNRFCVDFDDLCKCWNKRHPFRLNENMVKRLKIGAINFDREGPALWGECNYCGSEGWALLKYLASLPNLRSASLTFANVESFASCGRATLRKLRKLSKGASLGADDIGRLQISGLDVRLELRLPELIRTFPLASSRQAEDAMHADYSGSEEVFGEAVEMEAQMLFDEDTDDYSIYRTLRDILHHARTIGETSRELKPTMDKVVSGSGLSFERLDFGERANFTIALAECLSDMIDGDDCVEMADRSDVVEITPKDW
ncbi:hypothetical protein LTR37_005415 [Vermiconidia calcicola]|uniref:Uncharacterized protein n=1 Tax=Vermiconidia calcicola TaxID=1690605 RepID=A0ACC3NK97_9PEZI|nr:hypothetical protein LTR37_005415 [Vermiconidia calcicola]